MKARSEEKRIYLSFDKLIRTKSLQWLFDRVIHFEFMVFLKKRNLKNNIRKLDGTLS